MANDISSLPQKTVFDGWRSISISLYMTLNGYAVLVAVPVISSAWVNLLGFTEVEVGRVAGADLGGLSLGAIVAAMLVARYNRRHLVLVSAAIAIAANGLCMVMVEYDQVLWLRLVAGFGAGIYTAVAVVNLGATIKPARAFNMMLFAFAFSQALELHVLPQLSMNGIYTVFIGCYILGLMFLGWVPPHPLTAARKSGEALSTKENPGMPKIPAYVPWLVLGAILATYINIGAFWTYIELASVGTDANPDWVGKVLVWTSFSSLVGCLFATIVSNRFGLARPLMLALVAMAAAVGMLYFGITDRTFLISVFSFNFLWIFVDVYQMSTVANIDPVGRFAALMPGAQGLGQIIGPNLAASILAAGLGYDWVFVMCAAAALTGLIIYVAMYVKLRQIIPALADSS